MTPLPHQSAHPSAFLVGLFITITVFTVFGLVCFIRDIVMYLRDRCGRLD